MVCTWDTIGCVSSRSVAAAQPAAGRRAQPAVGRGCTVVDGSGSAVLDARADRIAVAIDAEVEGGASCSHKDSW